MIAAVGTSVAVTDKPAVPPMSLWEPSGTKDNGMGRFETWLGDCHGLTFGDDAGPVELLGGAGSYFGPTLLTTIGPSQSKNFAPLWAP